MSILNKIFKDRKWSKTILGEYPHNPYGPTLGETFDTIKKSLDKILSKKK